MIKNRKNEAQRIVDKYLKDSTTATLYGNIKEAIINEIVKNIMDFERPDILTFTENKIIGIEHFEFDSSKIGGKGSSYQREIGKITNEFNKVVDSELETKKEIIMHNDIKAENSLNNYYDNFKKYFLNHYKNVDSYIENIKESFNCDNKEVEIWFFAEDTSMLGSYYLNKERNIRVLNPLYSKENIELFKRSKKIKGLILGYYNGKEYKLTIVFNENKAIDN